MKTTICAVATDATLAYDALHRLIEHALDGRDASIALQDFTVKDAGALSSEPVMHHILEALHTPPFLIDRRVVAVRDAQLLTATEADQLIAWIQNPTPGVLVRIAVVGPATNKIAKAADEVVVAGVGKGRDEKPAFVRATFAHYGLQIDAAALSAIVAHLGDEIDRVDGLARTLQSIFGTAPLTLQHVTPYLGDAGNVPEWDLTNAIDRGNVDLALTIARRMLDSRGRAGLQIVSLLQRHFVRAVQVEGLAIGPGEAAALIGAKSEYPGTKALAMAQKLGPERLADAVAMIAKADLDLKGAVSFGGKDLESDQDITELTVIEVLVARLARLSAARR